MMSPLAYLRQELKFTVNEWTALSDADKTTLRAWAAEEMAALGMVE
jgi:hypothetical protein